MWEWVSSVSLALWFGVLTSISPCPLATNIAAISFVGKRVGHRRYVVLSGVVYALGRAAAYAVLGVFVIGGVFAIPKVSDFLQRYMNGLLGPFLIVMGVVLLELVELTFSASFAGDGVRRSVERWGIWGAGLLGVVFALSFCPVSAAWFFGGVIPLSFRSNLHFLILPVYGVGTALPVVVFAVLLSMGVQSLGRAYSVLTRMEWWARRITGVIFVVVGVYYSLKYIFGVVP